MRTMQRTSYSNIATNRKLTGMPSTPSDKVDKSASEIADESYSWYKTAAIRSRRCFRASEVATIVASAAIPVVAVILPGNTTASAILSAVAVVSTGLRSLFHWQENYLRYSRARESVEAERRRYIFKANPYHIEGARDLKLVEAITRIEQEEMGVWLQVSNSDKGTAANSS